MTRWTMNDDKLAEVIRLYCQFTGNVGKEDEITDAILEYDWIADELEHQNWLTSATAAEIADWLTAVITN